MTNLDTGIQGAKRKSWHAANTRELVLRLIKENPSADVADIIAASWEVAQSKAGQKYIFAAWEYAIANDYNAVKHERRPRTIKSAAQKARDDKDRRTRVEAIKAQVKQSVLLDMDIDGKKLRDMTGKECAKMGGWLARIGAAVKPNQKIGTLTEDRVRELRDHG